LPTVPKIQFFINKHVNLFYHTCVLFSEYFSDEYSFGILNNSRYKQQYGHLRTPSLHEKFQSLYSHSYYAWDFIGKSLFKSNTMTSTKKTLQGTSQNVTDIWLGILSEAFEPYEGIWPQTEAKLKEYMSRFEAEWNLINDLVLNRMADMTKLPWNTKPIRVHFADCVHGASSWIGDIVMPPFPDVDVEKKLLTHEIAHILMPEYFLRTKLQRLGLEPAISHTIVDLVAYFGIKEHVTDPERRGIKPNPEYYAQVRKLNPIFENCYKNPKLHRRFDDILKQIPP